MRTTSSGSSACCSASIVMKLMIRLSWLSLYNLKVLLVSKPPVSLGFLVINPSLSSSFTVQQNYHYYRPGVNVRIFMRTKQSSCSSSSTTTFTTTSTMMHANALQRKKSKCNRFASISTRMMTTNFDNENLNYLKIQNNLNHINHVFNNLFDYETISSTLSDGDDTNVNNSSCVDNDQTIDINNNCNTQNHTKIHNFIQDGHDDNNKDTSKRIQEQQRQLLSKLQIEQRIAQLEQEMIVLSNERDKIILNNYYNNNENEMISNNSNHCSTNTNKIFSDQQDSIITMGERNQLLLFDDTTDAMNSMNFNNNYNNSDYLTITSGNVTDLLQDQNIMGKDENYLDYNQITIKTITHNNVTMNKNKNMTSHRNDDHNDKNIELEMMINDRKNDDYQYNLNNNVVPISNDIKNNNIDSKTTTLIEEIIIIQNNNNTNNNHENSSNNYNDENKWKIQNKSLTKNNCIIDNIPIPLVDTNSTNNNIDNVILDRQKRQQTMAQDLATLAFYAELKRRNKENKKNMSNIHNQNNGDDNNSSNSPTSTTTVIQDYKSQKIHNDMIMVRKYAAEKKLYKKGTKPFESNSYQQLLARNNAVLTSWSRHYHGKGGGVKSRVTTGLNAVSISRGKDITMWDIVTRESELINQKQVNNRYQSERIIKKMKYHHRSKQREEDKAFQMPVGKIRKFKTPKNTLLVETIVDADESGELEKIGGRCYSRNTKVSVRKRSLALAVALVVGHRIFQLLTLQIGAYFL